METPRSTVAENPYASPNSEQVSPSVIWVEGAPRGVTLVDALVLGLGILAAVGLFAVTRGIDSLWLPSANDSVGVYLVNLYWLQLVAQAIGWVVLARVGRYGMMPRAWEWIPLLAWLELWPGTLLVYGCQALLGIESPMVGLGPYLAGGLVVQLVVTLLLAVALAAMLVAYVRLQSRLTTVAKVAFLLGLLWSFPGAILLTANHVVAILLELMFPGGQAPQVWYVAYAQIHLLPRGIIWWVPFLAGFLIMGTPRRWTEWAGVPIHPLLLALSAWLMVEMKSTALDEIAITVLGVVVTIGLSWLVLRRRRPLSELFGLSDQPKAPSPSESLPANQATA